MGRRIQLREAINLIWETVKITQEQENGAECPYIYIVGAGISAPEILTANGIIEHCQKKIRELYASDEKEVSRIFEEAETYAVNSTKYYSYWFGQAYKNKKHRQQYLKDIIERARISSSNLLLAQILNSKEIATTVITTNFDNQLVKSLNLLGNYDVFSANNVLDNIALDKNSKSIQILHAHGTYEFYDCCNLENEIIKVAHQQGIKTTAGTIEEFLKQQSPIVIGYSGWEDDVIMSKLKERMEYAALPYSLIWFCYSEKDYEILPNWLKESDDVVFVLPDLKKDIENEAKGEQEQRSLPAEDVLNALITKFGFEAPNLFSNPIQYYIDLIDGFLPENLDVFPIKSWKRRLDYIEEHLGEIDKQVIALDDAAARKDVVDITNVLRAIDYNFIPTEDMEHILNGIIMPLLNSKNRIENTEDLLKFLKEILNLLLTRNRDINGEKIHLYLNKIIAFLVYSSKTIEKEDLIGVYDEILSICNQKENCSNIALQVLGMKSDIVDEQRGADFREEIIKHGMNNIEDKETAEVVLTALFKQIRSQGTLVENYEEIITSIEKVHSQNKRLMERYYDCALDLILAGIELPISVSDIILRIKEKNLSSALLLYARRVQCVLEKDTRKQIQIAEEALANIDVESISECRVCFDYASLLGKIIIEKIDLKEFIDQKYIDDSIKLCCDEEECLVVSEIIVKALYFYICSIQSQFEKRELCKKIINICEKGKIYRDWCRFTNMYLECLEAKEREKYIEENKRYCSYENASQKISAAIKAYVADNKNLCKDLLLEASECFDEIFEERYNPALVNICFMARRGEILELNISVLDVLNKISWMHRDAIYNINKALVYIQQNNWAQAEEEIGSITYGIDDAVEWWSHEEVVGQKEKSTVLMLLILEKKILYDIEMEMDLKFALEEVDMPEDIKAKVQVIVGDLS